MYTDRLREFKYIAPSGKTYILQFDSLSRTGGKKAPVSEFPGQNQGAVQDLGNLTPTFPVECYITGTDYDVTADSFWEALHETGPGKLFHPRWGNLNVLPIPQSQAEDYVNGAGRAVFNITFIRTDAEQFVYPQVSEDFASKVTADVDEAATAITEGVPEEITDVATQAGTKASMLDTLGKITDGFDTITELTDDVRADINQVVADITNQIDALVQAPADLMTALLTLYRLPGTIDINVESKVDGYSTIYDNLITGYVDTTTKYGEDFGLIAVANINAIAIASGESTTAGDIPTRDSAGNVIARLTALYNLIRDSIQDLEDAGLFSTGYEMLQDVERAVTSAITGLIDQALNLPAERKQILEREVDPITFYYELFGNLDLIDDWMTFNSFTDNEILLIPRGREVRWFVS